MFNHLGQVFHNEMNLMYDDKPHYFPNLIKNVDQLASWNTVEDCVNNPQFYNFELIDHNNQKIQIPENKKAWINSSLVQDKSFIADCVNNGYTCIITNYGFYNQFVNELLHTFENLFDIHAAAHLYCGKGDTKSFTIHDDYPVNFIFQIEGETQWKVFNNRISYLYQTGAMNGQLSEDQLDCAVDVVLKPGDALYIPSRAYHVAYPSGNRISISVPCWNRLPTDPPGTEIDRNFYSINGE